MPAGTSRGSDPIAAHLPPKKFRARKLYFAVFTAALVVCFTKPLVELTRLALRSELYSHVLLIPFISGYLIWTDRKKLNVPFRPALGISLGLGALAISLVAGYWGAVLSGWSPALTSGLSLLIPAFVFSFAAGVVWCFGFNLARTIVFPLAFLIFMAPMPVALEDAVTRFLQHGSADASYWMLKAAGMTIFREGTTFKMPGVIIQVATECSGIRSSVVLFITSLVAAHWFLRRRWSKITLALAVIPLGIFRNALRIFVLSELAVHVNPDILDSDLHHKGGPIFFVVSLAPFFLLIWFLRKQEHRKDAK